MMLRGSTETAGVDVDLRTVVAGTTVDSQVSGGTALVRFTEAVLANPADLRAARQALVSELGEARMVDAAGVIGNFQRMVRIADSTGIPVDGFMAETMTEVREALGLNDMPSARLAG